MSGLNQLKFATDVDQLARARSRFVLVGLVFPVVIGLVGVVLMLLWLPELPDPAATHWSSLGAPDGFGPGWTFPLILGVLAVAFPALLAALVLPSTRHGRWGATIRFLGAFIPAMTAFLAVSLGWSVSIQRGLADARDASDAGVGLLAGLVAAVIVFLPCWFLQPRVEVSPEAAAPAQTISLEPGTRAVWVRSVRTATGGIVTVVIAAVVLVAAAVLAAVAASPVAWILTVVAAILVLLGLTLLAFTVTVDAAGLTVRGFIGWPVWRVPVADIAQVGVTDVNPLADFGGWGVRQAPGRRFGIVVRTGPAIEVHRHGGKIFVVTVDDADRGAALLQAFAGTTR